jgi:hypothetical protein
VSAADAKKTKKDPPLSVVLPSAKEDRPFTPKVGLIAIAGFAIGIAWPRLLGIHVGPDVPGGGADKERAVAPPAAAKSGAAAASSADDDEDPKGADSADAAEDAPSNQETVVIGDGAIASCKNKKGDKVDECGKLAFDKLAKSRLVDLSKCPDSLGLEGSMTVGVAINFEKNELSIVEGKKSALPVTTVRGVLACAAKALDGVELDKLVHTHAKYTVEYPITFYPPGKAPPPPPAPGEEATAAPAEAGLGTATVVWEKGLLRESPETGKVASRIPQGTRVTILEEQKGWFLVTAGKKKGWVAGGAIGK